MPTSAQPAERKVQKEQKRRKKQKTFHNVTLKIWSTKRRPMIYWQKLSTVNIGDWVGTYESSIILSTSNDLIFDIIDFSIL